nr:ATP-binding cassette domain-containing protein [Bacillus velezensis]
MVEVKNVSKQYGGKVVLEKTSLSIQKGRLTSFIGPNGAGKSTLLSIMSRLIKTDSGEITVDGQEIGPVKATIWRKKSAS